MNISITNVHTCCISTRKVKYACVMSSRMKPWEYGTRHVFKICCSADARYFFYPQFYYHGCIYFSLRCSAGGFVCLRRRLHLFLRLVNLHLPDLTSTNTKVFFLFVTWKSCEPRFVVEGGIIPNCLGKFAVENSILRRHFGQY